MVLHWYIGVVFVFINILQVKDLPKWHDQKDGWLVKSITLFLHLILLKEWMQFWNEVKGSLDNRKNLHQNLPNHDHQILRLILCSLNILRNQPISTKICSLTRIHHYNAQPLVSVHKIYQTFESFTGSPIKNIMNTFPDGNCSSVWFSLSISISS